jgi:redox-sensitive bicupin YhaK (pirin superfamily)
MKHTKTLKQEASIQMIVVRPAGTIHQEHGVIENGTFFGRWHFSFGDYHDRDWMRFGNLRVFNDDTLSPGAVWPLHPHREIEVVTYCADGEFRHADEYGKGGILKKGDVQHTTVGSGMWHSEINHRRDVPMRFIQMWFVPSRPDLEPSVEQKSVDIKDRTNRLLVLVSNKNPAGLKLFSDAEVYSCFLEQGRSVTYALSENHGGYLYVLEGGPIRVNDQSVLRLSAAAITEEATLTLTADQDSELLFVDTKLQT